MSRMLKYMIVDDFLNHDSRAALLEHTLASEHKFTPSVVANPDQHAYDPESRVAWYCPDGLGPVKSAFKTALAERLDNVLPQIGIKPFEIAGTELELAAHRDGSFFGAHIDTLTQSRRRYGDTDRIVTFVYYFHQLPRQFSGGEIVLHPFGSAPSVEIDAKDNRLVAFPSIALHEVKRVRAPADFAGARFAVNCWLHRGRGD